MSEILTSILIFIIVYLAYLFIWFIINLLAYFSAIAFKKPAVLGAIVGLSVIIVQILNFGIGIGLLLYTISLLFDGQFLWFLVMIFIGIGLISGILGFLQMPFMLIPGYFAEKIEEIDLEEDVERAELLDEKGNVLDVLEGEGTVATRLAKYFLALYALGLVTLIIMPVEREGITGLGFLTEPFWDVARFTFFVGIPYAIYHKVKKKSFFPKDKRYFLISVWRISLIIGIPLVLFVFLLALATNTL